MRFSFNGRPVTPRSAAMRLALAWAVGLACPAGAQTPPTLVSPEIAADRAVTFRLWAPNASAVELSGNWMGARPPVPLAKGLTASGR